MADARKMADTLTEEEDRARERVREVADSAIQNGREKWKEWRERSGDALNEARMRGAEVWEDAQRLVRKYPARTVGVALLVGTFIGILIASRSED